MAEEQAQNQAPAPAPQQSGGKPILFIVLAVFNMIVVGGVGAMIYLGKQKEAKEPGINDVVKGEHEKQVDEAENPVFIGKLIPLETFLVNLAQSGANRLVKINMELEVSNADVQAEIDHLKPKIRDIIIIIVSSKSFKELSNKEGKNSLREEIKDQVNLFLTKGQINRVYFTEFLYN